MWSIMIGESQQRAGQQPDREGARGRGRRGRFRNAGNTQEREDLERGGTVTEKDEENHKQEQSHSLVEGQTYCGSQ